MLKAQYRSEMSIIHDIMSLTAHEGLSGVIVSRLSRQANLSYYTLIEKCERLIEAGLMEMIQDPRNRFYIITEKGIKFFNELTRFQNLVQSLNLRC
jgi:predicted transcriptional regulator